MSVHRENVVWQSPNGTWNIGFYDHYPVNTGSENYDSEWDVQYTDKFHWVSSGHRTAAQAGDAHRGANHGGSSVIEYREADPESVEDVERLEDKAAQVYIDSKSKGNDSRTQPVSYQGPPRKRKIGFVAQDLYTAKLQAFYYKTGGYANKPDERIPAWEKEVDAFDPTTAPMEDFAGLAKAQADYIKGVQAYVKQAEEQKRQLSSWSSPEERNRAAKAVEYAKEFETEALTKLLRGETKPQAVKATAPVSKNETPSKPVSSRKYHISPTTGRPNLCSANVRACPFGGEADHYSTKDEARAGYEKKMGSGLGKLKK